MRLGKRYKGIKEQKKIYEVYMKEIKTFQDLVNLITQDELVLPDFQRKFIWKEKRMINLYSSVLCRMPIGSILTLESDDGGFACKKIGAKIRDDFSTIVPGTEKITYLIDGQQRITSLFAGFSTYFFEAYKNSKNNLGSKILKNMFFLKIPAKVGGDDIDDLFNVRELKFPDRILKGKDFYSTYEMKEIICSEKPSVILEKKTDMLIDISNLEHLNLIEKYCTTEKDGAYRIPLQYINNDNDSIQLSYDTIISKIATSYSISLNADENDRARKLWQKNIQKYLSESLLTLQLTQISVEDSNKSRAIDIYSNLNQGGAPLSVFDLVTAKVGGASSVSYNYYDKVVELLTDKFELNLNVIPSNVKDIIENYSHSYNVVEKSKIIEKNEISSQFIDVFLKVLTFYITAEINPNSFKPEKLTKRDTILELDANKIATNTELICISLKRALFFFQTRCGIRQFSDINYNAQLGLVAYIFTRDDLWEDKTIHDFLEYWYWISLFGYKYAIKQDISIYEEINKFLGLFKSNDTTCYNELKNYRINNVLKVSNVTDEATLTMENVASGIIPPAKIATFICQFYLSQGYKDFHTDEEINFLTESILQMHHIITLGGDKKIGELTKNLREDENNPHNSPLNYIYITQTSNLDISDMKFVDYSKDDKVSKALKSIHYNSVIDGVTLDTFIPARFKTLETELDNRLDALEKSIEKKWINQNGVNA